MPSCEMLLLIYRVALFDVIRDKVIQILESHLEILQNYARIISRSVGY